MLACTGLARAWRKLGWRGVSSFVLSYGWRRCRFIGVRDGWDRGRLILVYIGLVPREWRAVKVSSHFTVAEIAGVSDLERL